MQQIQETFDRWWWTAISLVIAITLAVLGNFVLWGPEAKVPPWFGRERTAHLVFALILIGLVSYAISQILIRVFLAVYWLRRLWKEQGESLTIHPYHADGAGGLGAIGQYAISFSYFMMMVMLFIVMGSILPFLTGQDESSLSLWNPLILLEWLLYLIIVPMSFGWLLWPPHGLMLKKRNEQLNAVSDELQKRLANTKVYEETGDWARLPIILKEIEHFKAMRNLILNDFPRWPINRKIRQQLRFTSVFPVLNLIVTLVYGLFKK